MKHPWIPDDFPPLVLLRQGQVVYARLRVISANAPPTWLQGMKRPDPPEARVVPVDRSGRPLMAGYMVFNEDWLVTGEALISAATRLSSPPPKS